MSPRLNLLLSFSCLLLITPGNASELSSTANASASSSANSNTSSSANPNFSSNTNPNLNSNSNPSANASLRGPMRGSGMGTLTANTSNQIGAQGILSAPSSGHQPGFLTRTIGGAVSDVGHAAVAIVGATIGNQGIDLPPDDASAPEWPFSEPNRKALFTVTWSDGSTGKISRLPDGSLQILGSGHRYTLQPIGGGSFALLGDYGSMATMTPRMDGGFTILDADGTVEQVLPREGGGFTITGVHGVVATILPGPTGRHHILGSKHYSSGFLQ